MTFLFLHLRVLGVSEPADNSVTSAKIVDGAIVNADINASAAIAGSKIDGSSFASITSSGSIVISQDNAIHFNTTNGNDFDAILRENSGNVLLINSRNDAILNIDSNNDSTDAHFAVAHGAATSSSTELFRVQENGNVGIGTSSPDALLDVVNTGGAAEIICSSSTQPRLMLKTSGTTAECRVDFGDSGDSSRGAVGYNHSDDALKFYTTGVANERMRIDSSGQVGIGVTPDTWSTGAGITVGTSQGTLWGAGDQINLSGNAYFNSGWKAAASKAGASQIEQALGNIDFKVSGSVTADSAITFTNAMRIDSDGDVLVGLTTALNTQAGSIQAAGPIIAKSYINAHTSNAAVLQYIANKTVLRAYGATSGSGILQFNVGGGGDATDFEAMRIDSSGRLLIGHTANRTINSHTPRLQIQGTDYSSSTVSIINNANSSNGAYLFFIKQRSGSPGGTTIAQNGDLIGQLRFSYADGVDIEHPAAYIEAKVDGTPGANSTPARVSIYTNGASTGPSERVRIEPTGALTFVGASTRAGNTNSICSINNNSIDVNVTEYFYLRHGNGTEILRARSTGNVSIGTTNTTHRFTAQNTSATQITGFFLSESTSYSVSTLQSNCSRNTSNGSYTHFKCAVNGVADKFRVLDSGALESTSNSIGGISDERLKENIVDAGSQWDDIKNIRVRKFNFKKLTDPEQKTMLGVVAQEAETVCPGLVESTVQLQEGVEQEYKSFKYSILYMKAIKALQEAQTRIETLETKVAALEAK